LSADEEAFERAVDATYRSDRMAPSPELDGAIRAMARDAARPRAAERPRAVSWVGFALAAGVLLGVGLDTVVLRPDSRPSAPVYRGPVVSDTQVPPEVAKLPPSEWLQLVKDNLEAGDIQSARRLLDAFEAAHPNYEPPAGR